MRPPPVGAYQGLAGAFFKKNGIIHDIDEI